MPPSTETMLTRQHPTIHRASTAEPAWDLASMAVKGKALQRASSAGLLKREGGLLVRCPSLPSVGSKCHGRRQKDKFEPLGQHAFTSLLKEADPALADKWLFSLGPGVKVRIGERLFDVGAALGSGSFGTVWAATSASLKNLAVKEISCQSPGALVYAIYEAKVLKSLSRHIPEQLAPRLPALIARDTVSIGPERWLVRLAMSRLPGVSLSTFLKRRLRPSSCLGPAQLRIQIAEACDLSRELLSQLAPAFEHISRSVFHRDVNPNNIMVDNTPAGPRFGLIDFGLATDAARWRTDVSSPGDVNLSRLERCGVVGHGCFWPPSSWFAFGHGPQELFSHPELRFEFGECLDFHGLGLVAIKILAEGLPSRGGCSSQNANDNRLLLKFLSLKKAWDRYFQNVSHCWRRVMETPKDEIILLKTELIRLNVHKAVHKDVKRMRRSLKEAGIACSATPQEHSGSVVTQEHGLSDAPSLFDSISLMISGAEKPSVQPSWKILKADVDAFEVMPLAGREKKAASLQSPSSPHRPRNVTPLPGQQQSASYPQSPSCMKALCSAISSPVATFTCQKAILGTPTPPFSPRPAACSSVRTPSTTAPPSQRSPPLSEAAWTEASTAECAVSQSEEDDCQRFE